MSDNILKKNFQKKDVERLRNLIKGKGSQRTGQGIGYTKKQQFHKEGDIWKEDGRTWTIKDGIKQNITKLDKFKKAAVPLFCPTCNTIMNKQLDPHYFKTYGGCLDCIKKKETKLKLDGTWKKFRDDVHNEEIDQTIEEFSQFFEMKMSESNDGYVTEAGEIEKWKGGLNKEKAKKTLEDGIEYLKSLKK